MPSSTDPHLVKSLHYHLSHKLSIRELRACGWFDYVNLDSQPTTSSVSLAADAFLYLSVSKGCWSGHVGVLVAVLAFLEEQTERQGSSADIQALKSLLEANPCDEAAVRAWFARTYPEH